GAPHLRRSALRDRPRARTLERGRTRSPRLDRLLLPRRRGRPRAPAPVGTMAPAARHRGCPLRRPGFPRSRAPRRGRAAAPPAPLRLALRAHRVTLTEPERAGRARRARARRATRAAPAPR